MLWSGGALLFLVISVTLISILRMPETIYQKVVVGDFSPTIAATGRVSALKPKLVLTGVAGRLTSINVLAGQEVTEGQLIAVLENPQLEQDLEESELMLLKSENAYEKTEIEQELLTIGYQKKLRLAAQDLRILELKSQSNNKLLEKNIISRLDYQIANIRYKQAQEDLIHAKHELKLHQNIQAKVLQSALNGVLLSQKKLRRSQKRYAALSVVAPSSGTILELTDSLEIGESLNPGDLLLTLFDSKSLLVSMRLPPKKSQQIAIGNTVDVNIDKLTYRAEIIAIDQQVNQGTVTALAQFAQQAMSGLQPNLDVQVRIYMDPKSNVLKLPKLDWYQGPGTYTVSKEVNNDELIEIKVGLADTIYAEIDSGLLAGDMVSITTLKAK